MKKKINVIGSPANHGLEGKAYYSGVYVFDPDTKAFIWFDSRMSAKYFTDWVSGKFGLAKKAFVFRSEVWNKKTAEEKEGVRYELEKKTIL